MALVKDAKEPLIHDLANSTPETQKNSKSPFSALVNDKWRTTVSVGALLATLVLATNVCLLVWATSSFPNKDGVATVFEGA